MLDGRDWNAYHMLSWVLFFINKKSITTEPSNLFLLLSTLAFIKSQRKWESLHPSPWNFPLAAARADQPILRL